MVRAYHSEWLLGYHGKEKLPGIYNIKVHKLLLMTVHGFARSALLLISGTTIVHFIAALYTDVKKRSRHSLIFMCICMCVCGGISMYTSRLMMMMTMMMIHVAVRAHLSLLDHAPKNESCASRIERRLQPATCKYISTISSILGLLFCLLLILSCAVLMLLFFK